MKLICVGTGSSGNGYVLECSDGKILLDVGCSWKGVQKACGHETRGILFALVTHEHG